MATSTGIRGIGAEPPWRGTVLARFSALTAQCALLPRTRPSPRESSRRRAGTRDRRIGHALPIRFAQPMKGVTRGARILEGRGGDLPASALATAKCGSGLLLLLVLRLGPARTRFARPCHASQPLGPPGATAAAPEQLPKPCVAGSSPAGGASALRAPGFPVRPVRRDDACGVFAQEPSPQRGAPAGVSSPGRRAKTSWLPGRRNSNPRWSLRAGREGWNWGVSCDAPSISNASTSKRAATIGWL